MVQELISLVLRQSLPLLMRDRPNATKLDGVIRRIKMARDGFRDRFWVGHRGDL